MDFAAAGNVPPAIWAKSYLVSHQLRAMKWQKTISNNYIVQWVHLFTSQPYIYQETGSEGRDLHLP